MESSAKNYYKKVHFWGQLTLGLGIVFSFVYAVYLSFFKGYHPGWDRIFTGFLGVAAMVGHTWVNLADLMTYILLMGPAATYMSSLTGNIKNMRLPSVLAAKAAVSAEQGTPKEDIISTIGVISSTLVNTLFLATLVIGGVSALKVLPSSFIELLSYIVPALFGAIFAQFALMNYKSGIIAITVSFLIINLKFLPGYLKTFLTIILTILINILIHNKGKKTKYQS